ncbi:DUF6538 domain-containing protein [Sphingomonas kaistensis]|uniref:DUF6538 domain-containing protein n=1 Tax=Sphingomonas kaistensis TaxID=298708 RepID=A0ABZ2G258_9SPHN
MKKSSMATPFADPRTGQLYFRRAIPQPLWPAFGGKRERKITLGTKDPLAAKEPFARLNAEFEADLATARRKLAEGTLLPTPGAVVRRWCESPPSNGGLSGQQRFLLTLMELDAGVGGRFSASPKQIYPSAITGPAVNTDWNAVLGDCSRFESIVTHVYGSESEQVGTNWIRSRWHEPEKVWHPHLLKAADRIRHFVTEADRFSAEEIARALLAVLDEKRPADEDFNRARLAKRRHRPNRSRLRPNLRLKQLFNEWQDGNKPRPQTALEFEASINDFIDFAGDVPVSEIDADMLYDYRDEASKLPSTMPRADRALPFRARVEKHGAGTPKCSPATLKKRVGALQALLTYAFQQRWTSSNNGAGITIIGYSKKRKIRRSFEDHELALLFTRPLFVDPTSWNSPSRISDVTIFWLFLIAATTGARLEEVGQVALADVRRDGDIVYLDISDHVLLEDGEDKSVKNDESRRLVPIHANLDIFTRKPILASATAGSSRTWPAPAACRCRSCQEAT